MDGRDKNQHYEEAKQQAVHGTLIFNLTGNPVNSLTIHIAFSDVHIKGLPFQQKRYAPEPALLFDHHAAPTFYIDLPSNSI
jgi:hypothetical protein